MVTLLGPTNFLLSSFFSCDGLHCSYCHCPPSCHCALRYYVVPLPPPLYCEDALGTLVVLSVALPAASGLAINNPIHPKSAHPSSSRRTQSRLLGDSVPREGASDSTRWRMLKLTYHPSYYLRGGTVEGESSSHTHINKRQLP